MKTWVTRTGKEPCQWLLQLAITVLCLTVTLTRAHPQCLDSNPPFTSPSSYPPTLCSHYHSSGCCSPQDEDTLQDVYLYVKHRLREEEWNLCKDHVQNLLCARCSPLSAHLFERESGTSSRQYLPGMCPDFCRKFYQTCRNVVWILEPDLAASLAIQSAEDFCEQMVLSDMTYCYSDQHSEIVDQEEMESDGTHGSDSPEGCLCLDPIMQGLANPVVVRHAGDDSGRLFVGEQRGLVYVVDPVSKEQSGGHTPFLNITDRLILTSRYDERGLGGLAFHPNYSTNGRLFVYYNAPPRARGKLTEEERKLRWRWNHMTRLSEMHVMPGYPGTVDPSSERVLLEVNHPFANHNGGEMFFLDDGYLYLFIGDGGYKGDPYNLAQNISWLLGKVLRLDVDTPSPDLDRAYSIPPDNPFVDPPDPSSSSSSSSPPRPEIFAYGVRNIWRCGVDMGDPDSGQGRGRVLCGDVGQARYEEIDLLKKGANYGWRAREGFECYDTAMCGKIGKEELPVHAYNHSIGQSVTGGQFYRGACFPALNGLYIYGDYQSKRLFSLQEVEDGTWHNSDLTLCGADLCSHGLTNRLDRILSFGQDQQGEVYILTSNSSMSSTSDGGVYRIVDPRSVATGERCKFSQTSTASGRP